MIDHEALVKDFLEYAERHNINDYESRIIILEAVLANREPDPQCRTARDWLR